MILNLNKISKTLVKVSLLFFAAILSANHAFSGSPISNVGGSSVNKGELDIQARFGYQADKDGNSSNNRLRTRQHIDYGVTDWYAFRALVFQDKRAGENIEHDTIAAETRFQLIEKRDHGWDAGFRLRYYFRDGDKKPDEVRLSLLAQVPFAKFWEFRHNIIMEHAVGADSQNGILLTFRNKISRNFQVDTKNIKKASLGLATYSDLGNMEESLSYSEQDHELRAILKIQFKNNLAIRAGYGFALSDAGANRNVMLWLGKEF